MAQRYGQLPCPRLLRQPQPWWCLCRELQAGLKGTPQQAARRRRYKPVPQARCPPDPPHPQRLLTRFQQHSAIGRGLPHAQQAAQEAQVQGLSSAAAAACAAPGIASRGGCYQLHRPHFRAVGEH
jgi:hypothetical protein